jgi:putative hemolysin
MAFSNPVGDGKEFACTKPYLGLNVAIHAALHPRADGSVYSTLLRQEADGLKLLDLIPRILRRTLGIESFSRARQAALQDKDPHADPFTKLARAMKIEPEYDPAQLAAIPTEGPVVVIANHPLAAAEAWAIMAALNKVRPVKDGVPQAKLVLTDIFKNLPEFQDHGLFVNVVGDGSNEKVKSDATQWVKQGNVLLIFPAGDMSWVKPGDKIATDPPWAGGVAKFIRESRATVVPIYVHGQMSPTYSYFRNNLKLVAHAMTMNEMMNLQGKTIKLSIGDPVPYEKLEPLSRDEIIPELRRLTYGAGGIVEPVGEGPLLGNIPGSLPGAP